jgi:hypothetical protein
MRRLGIVLVIAAALVVIFATGLRMPSPATPPAFVMRESLSPTPIPHAARRYANFVFHYRKEGDTRAFDVPVASVQPTRDSSVLAVANVSMQRAPVRGQRYERWFTYTLDGVPQRSGDPTEALVDK